jgi:hypothetical protein
MARIVREDWRGAGQENARISIDEKKVMEKEKPARGYLAGLEKDPAASYSPTGLPQQYHWLRGA